MMRDREKNTSVLGVAATIAAGFDLTAKHFWLVFLPTLLDVFFWLGPRLSFRTLLERVVSLWPAGASLEEMSGQLLALASQTNLFTSLSVPVLGVPALMVGIMPEKTPLTPPVIEVESIPLLFLLFIIFNLVGLLLTAVYFGLIARVVREQGAAGERETSAKEFWRRVGFTWLRLLGMVVLFLALMLALYIPLLLVGLILSFISQVLFSLVLFVGPLVAIWMLIYFFFAPHGLVLNGRPLRRALVESVRLVYTNVLPTMVLLLAILVIGSGLDWLLLTADDGSWLTLAGLLAHAFVSTALIVATFIFYRDRYATIKTDQSDLSSIERVR